MRCLLPVVMLAALATSSTAATYFAQVTSTGKISRVIVVPDNPQPNGEIYANKLFGGAWRQTYIDGSARGSYAGSSKYIYDAPSDSFQIITPSIIGDSITANMAAAQPSLLWPFTYAQNLGVSGNTVAQIQARLGSVATTATHVIIEAGTNDLLGLGTDANILPGYTLMLKALSSKRVIVLGIPQIDEAAIRSDWLQYLNNNLIAAQNAKIAALCATFSNCVSATSVMSMSMVGKTIDGIHPLPSAYPEFVANILSAF